MPAELVYRFFNQVLNLGDLDELHVLLTPDCRHHVGLVAGLPPGPAGLKPFIALLRDTFADFHCTFEETPGAIRWTLWGVHQAEFLDVPATFKPVAIPGKLRIRVSGEQIAELWLELSVSALRRQLGVRVQNQ